MSDIGPQKQPSSVAKVHAESKAVARLMTDSLEHLNNGMRMREYTVTCQGCGGTEAATLPELDKKGWSWHTGFRDFTAYWCLMCQKHCTSAYEWDRSHAMSAPTTGQANGGCNEQD